MGSFHPIDEYIALPRPKQTWIVEPVLPSSGRLAIFSGPKVGKSWAALQMCADVSAGRDEWLGFPIRMSGPTFYLQLDTPRGLWIDEYIMKMRELTDHPYTLEGVHVADLEDAPSYPFDIRYRVHQEWLREQVDRIKPVLVVVDTYREMFRGNENDSDTAQDALSSLVGATHPAALVILSHRAKESQDPDAVPRSITDEIRGNTYLGGAVDAIIRVRKKGFTYISRTTEQQNIRLERHSSGIWLPPAVEMEPLILQVLSDSTLSSLRDRARKLAELSGKSEAAALSAIHRHVQAGIIL